MMTQRAFVSITTHKQKGGTCYANAVATVIRATENRIIGRKPKSHSQLVAEIVKDHGDKGGNTFKVLKEQCKKRQLRCDKVFLGGAKSAIKAQRPIIGRFSLYDNQWDIFSDHFENDSAAVLIKSQLAVIPTGKKDGHAVCIMGANFEQKYWKIKNSWGDNWADGGYCRVAFDAMHFSYYDCYFVVADLTETDKQYPMLKNYSSLCPMGKGAFGDVYKAHDIKNKNRIVAVKKMSNADYKTVGRELELLSKCKSKYIIKLLNIHSYSNYYWIVLEYCSGGSIEHLAGNCSEIQIKKIAFDVLNGLYYLHSNNLIHRDIKPSNILHSGNDIYKLADFGSSKDVTNALKKTFSIGTPHFMAPEMIKHADTASYDATVDIWSLGCTLYKLITTQFPYNFKNAKKNSFDVMDKIVRTQPKKLDASQLNGFTCSGEICDIVNNCCLVKNSKDRSSAETLLQHQWFCDDDEKQQVEETMIMSYCESIKSVVENKYPAAYSVWQQEPEGTIAFLQAKGIIETQQLLKEFDMPFKEGTNNIEAWVEYKEAIYTYLSVINSDDRLKQAREIVSNEIWMNHYKRFPCWPKPNNINKDVIPLNKKDQYVYKNKWFIVWSIGGSITITDHRPSKSIYKARFNGMPTFRVLKVDNKKFSAFNTLCVTNKTEAIKRVQECSNMAITWDSL